MKREKPDPRETSAERVGSPQRYHRGALSVDDVYAFETGPADPNAQHKKLLAAVLERAITDGLGNPGRADNPERDIEGAYAWLVHEKLSEKPTPFSFQWVCEALDLNPEALREKIIWHKEKGNMYYPGKTPGRAEKNKPLEKALTKKSGDSLS